VEPFQMTLTEAAQRIAATEHLRRNSGFGVGADSHTDGRVGAFVEILSDSRGPTRKRPIRRCARQIGRATSRNTGLGQGSLRYRRRTDQRRFAGAGGDRRGGAIRRWSSGYGTRSDTGGKTRTHEFAFGYTTPGTRNPWNLGHIAVVRAWFGRGRCCTPVFHEHGPRTLAGRFGSPLRTRRRGFQTNVRTRVDARRGSVGRSFDHAGPSRAPSPDVAVTMDAIADTTPGPGQRTGRSPTSLGPCRERARAGNGGIPANLFLRRLPPEVEAAVRAAIDVLRVNGAPAREVDVPLAEEITKAHFDDDEAEAAACHRARLRDQAPTGTPTRFGRTSC